MRGYAVCTRLTSRWVYLEQAQLRATIPIQSEDEVEAQDHDMGPYATWSSAVREGFSEEEADDEKGPTMNWRIFEGLLRGVNKYSMAFGRIWLTLVFVFRMLVCLVTAERMWSDDHKDFNGNTHQQGFSDVCYDEEAREKKHHEAAGEGGGCLYLNPSKKPGGLWWTYVCTLVVKAGVDSAFLYVFHSFYPRYTLPHVVKCPEAPCPSAVDCFISRPAEKNIFTLLMVVTAATCSLLSLVELAYLVSKRCRECLAVRKPRPRAWAITQAGPPLPANRMTCQATSSFWTHMHHLLSYQATLETT
ncbi:hypothetical protein MC885_017420 [Smutsia gigantea]|nr:hypothetical protein MC885_017420 [Smutsia gigantea]